MAASVLASPLSSRASFPMTGGSWGAHLAARLRADSERIEAIVTVPHPLLCLARRGACIVVLAPVAVWARERPLLAPYAAHRAAGESMLLLFGDGDLFDLHEASEAGVAGLLSERATIPQISVSLTTAFALMEAKAQAQSRGRWLNRYRYELGELVDTARAIENERDIDRLLELILHKCRLIAGADAGSIYTVDADAQGEPQLRFKLSQNDSAAFDSRASVLPVNARSMAGAAALYREPLFADDVYRLPPDARFGFDRTFDEKTGYFTKSVFCLPLVARSNEVIGVIQLINKKRDPNARLLTRQDVEREVVGFDERSRELLCTLGAQAGVSLENALLLEEIRTIFEGFVRASVEAIEQRDPTTSGHSRRVSHLTVALARAVERVDTGPYREVVWSVEDLREIEYASLLHDFGKIGVREQVLVKAKKLPAGGALLIRERLELAIRALEVEVLTRKLALVERRAPQSLVDALDADFAARRLQLEEIGKTVQVANEPTVLDQCIDPSVLHAAARQTFMGLAGEPRPLLTADELTSLSTPRGTLTHSEMDEIRSHVVHTFHFLSTIPWGKNFRRVPLIAGAHHEKLDGSGYPKGLRGEQIPLQSKLLSVSDIFDALTASDRPYKRAVPVDAALDILGLEVRAQHLDGELVRIFRESRAWEQLPEETR